MSTATATPRPVFSHRQLVPESWVNALASGDVSGMSSEDAALCGAWERELVEAAGGAVAHSYGERTEWALMGSRYGGDGPAVMVESTRY